MADAKVPKKNGGFDLSPVTTSHLVKGGSLRNPPWVKIRKTGYSETNTEGTGVIVSNLGEWGIQGRENLKVSFGASPKTGVIGIYLSGDDTPGGQQVRDSGNQLYFHLGGVFKEHPTLRPNTDVVCGLSFSKDSNGTPCFVFNVLQGTPASTTRRKKGSAEADAKKQAAPGKQSEPGTGESSK